MNILQVITPSRIGGAETYFLSLVESLCQRGHAVTVVCKSNTELARLLRQRGVDLRAWKIRGKLDVRTFFRLHRLVREEKIDLINVHLSTATFWGCLVGKTVPVPVVARVPATGHAFPYAWADKLIAVSQAVKEHLVTQGVPADRIEVLYNGIDLKKFAEKRERQEVRATWGLSPHVPVVGTVASLTARKGHRFLLQAAVQICQEFPDVHFVFAGEGDQEEKLRQLAASLGLSDQVKFLGFQSDVIQVLSALDLFVLPSLREGLPNVVMEALALEIPTVATDVAGTREVLRNGETGWLVPPGDSAALSEALRDMLRNPTSAHHKAQAGRTLLQNDFDRDRCLDRVEDFLVTVATSYSSP